MKKSIKINIEEPKYKDFELAYKTMDSFLKSMRPKGYFFPADGSNVNNDQVEQIHALRDMKIFVDSFKNNRKKYKKEVLKNKK